MKLTHKISSYYCRTISFFEAALAPLLFLFIRFWMARIFFKSGMVKWGSWQTTVSLFRFEYKTPFFTPEAAAFLSMSIELIAPVFLAVGLATRLAALPMLVMVIVIQLTYRDLAEHYYWMMLLSLLVLKGPGALSLDYWVATRWCKR
ncbi:MAG: DoxX family protein [Pseudomonadota bacterium]